MQQQVARQGGGRVGKSSPLNGRITQLRTLAAQGHAPRTIAERLGVTAQRVINLAGAHGITFARDKIVPQIRAERAPVFDDEPEQPDHRKPHDIRAQMVREGGGYVEVMGRMVWQSVPRPRRGKPLYKAAGVLLDDALSTDEYFAKLRAAWPTGPVKPGKRRVNPMGSWSAKARPVSPLPPTDEHVQAERSRKHRVAKRERSATSKMRRSA